MTRRIAKRIGWTALALLVILAAAVYWLFYDGGPASGAGYRLDLAELRRAADAPPGPKPTAIEIEFVSRIKVPGIAMTSGGSWDPVELARVSYRVVSPAGSVVIDTAHDAADARRWGYDRFDRRAYARVLVALDRASAIVVTHEHADHLAGALESPHLARFLPRLLLTPEQLDSPQAPIWPAGSARSAPFAYDRPKAIAPGVVLIKAPGHTPGSQMIYVRQADGREFLFMGDVASMLDNVTLQRQRSRYVTSVRGRSDRQEVADVLRALGDLHRADPELVLVPGHDASVLRRLVEQGMLRQGFFGKSPEQASGFGQR